MTLLTSSGADPANDDVSLAYRASEWTTSLVTRTRVRRREEVVHASTQIASGSLMMVADVASLEPAWRLNAPSSRPQMGLVAEELRERLLNALTSSPLDFRSVNGLAAELGISASLTRHVLEMMSDQVRHPVRAREDEADLYRLRTRGTTRQEKLRRIMALLARD